MNGVQLTFFNFAGYFVPGVVGILSLSPLFYFVAPSHPFTDIILATMISDDGSIRGSSLALLAIPGLVVSFLLGVMISGTASLIPNKIKSKGWLFYHRAGASLFAELERQGWDEAILQNTSLRQALALQATTGWDLYGSAARARMCNACGFTLSIAAVCYAFFSIHVFLILMPFGLYLIVLGLKLHADFWDFVDAIAYLRVTFDREATEHP